MTTQYPLHVQRYTTRQMELARNLAGSLTLAPEVKQAMHLPRAAPASKRK